MKVEAKALQLYAVTDRAWASKKSLATQVEEVLIGGATFIQLREKDLAQNDFIAEAMVIKEICRKYQVPFVINDAIEVAIACDADGIHIGQSDGAVKEVRARLGSHKILGVSAQTVEQALQAERDGADYIGVGAMFDTETKKDASKVPYEELKAICNAVRIPVVAIGGIRRENLQELKGSGIAGVALVSALFAAADIVLATQEIKVVLQELLTLHKG